MAATIDLLITYWICSLHSEIIGKALSVSWKIILMSLKIFLVFSFFTPKEDALFMTCGQLCGSLKKWSRGDKDWSHFQARIQADVSQLVTLLKVRGVCVP